MECDVMWRSGDCAELDGPVAISPLRKQAVNSLLDLRDRVSDALSGGRASRSLSRPRSFMTSCGQHPCSGLVNTWPL